MSDERPTGGPADEDRPWSVGVGTEAPYVPVTQPRPTVPAAPAALPGPQAPPVQAASAGPQAPPARERPIVQLGGHDLSAREHGRDDQAASARLFARPLEFDSPHPGGARPHGIPKLWEAVPDTVIDGADLPGLTVRGASLRGDDHRYYGQPRQDSMGIWALTGDDGTEAVLVCVADGVGSQPQSHRGSVLACQTLRNLVAANVNEFFDSAIQQDPADFARFMAGRVAREMRDRAAEYGVDPVTLSTTLVGAVIELAPPGRPRRCTLLRVGDSSAYLLRDSAFHGCLTDAHPDETIVSSATAALPVHVGNPDTGIVELWGDDMLLLCTDGLTNPMRNAEVREQLLEWWSRRPLPSLLEFGWQLGFRAKSYGDDRTAICVWGR